MARSFLGNVAKHSLEPTGAEFAQFVDNSVMQPETLMRNEEERLAYHTRENLNLADRGLIDREAVPQKALLDSGQAKTQQDALIKDMTNRGLIQKHLLAEYAAAGTIDPNRKQTIKYVDPKTGDTRTKTTFRNLTQPETLDESLGNLKSQGIGSNLVEQDVVSKKFVKPKGRGGSYKGGVGAEWVGAEKFKTLANQEFDMIKSAISEGRLFGGDAAKQDAAVRIISGNQYMSTDSKMDALDELINDDYSAQVLSEIRAGVLSKYTPRDVMTSSGGTEVLKLAEAPGLNRTLRHWNAKTGGKRTNLSTIPGFTDEADRVYYQLSDQNGENVYVDKVFLDANADKVRDTFNRGDYHIDTSGRSKMQAVKPSKLLGKKESYVTPKNQRTDALKSFLVNNSNSADLKDANIADGKLELEYEQKADRLTESKSLLGGLWEKATESEDEEQARINNKVKELYKKDDIPFIVTEDGEVKPIKNEVALLGDRRKTNLQKQYVESIGDLERATDNIVKMSSGGTLPNATATDIDGVEYPMSVAYDVTPTGTKINFMRPGTTEVIRSYDMPLDTKPTQVKNVTAEFLNKLIKEKFGATPANSFVKGTSKALLRR